MPDAKAIPLFRFLANIHTDDEHRAVTEEEYRKIRHEVVKPVTV